MPALTRAINEGHWKLVALCLVLGLMETLNRLPPDAINGLIEVLDGGKSGRKS